MFKGNEDTGRFRRECLIAIGTDAVFERMERKEKGRKD